MFTKKYSLESYFPNNWEDWQIILINKLRLAISKCHSDLFYGNKDGGLAIMIDLQTKFAVRLLEIVRKGFILPDDISEAKRMQKIKLIKKEKGGEMLESELELNKDCEDINDSIKNLFSIIYKFLLWYDIEMEEIVIENDSGGKNTIEKKSLQTILRDSLSELESNNEREAQHKRIEEAIALHFGCVYVSLYENVGNLPDAEYHSLINMIYATNLASYNIRNLGIVFFKGESFKVGYDNLMIYINIDDLHNSRDIESSIINCIALINEDGKKKEYYETLSKEVALHLDCSYISFHESLGGLSKEQFEFFINEIIYKTQIKNLDLGQLGFCFIIGESASLNKDLLFINVLELNSPDDLKNIIMKYLLVYNDKIGDIRNFEKMKEDIKKHLGCSHVGFFNSVINMPKKDFVYFLNTLYKANFDGIDLRKCGIVFYKDDDKLSHVCGTMLYINVDEIGNIESIFDRAVSIMRDNNSRYFEFQIE